MSPKSISMSWALLLSATFTVLSVGCDAAPSNPKSVPSDEPDSDDTRRSGNSPDPTLPVKSDAARRKGDGVAARLYVPEDTHYVVALRPAACLASSLVQPFANEAMIRRTAQGFGFDRFPKTEMVVAWGRLSGDAGVAVRFDEPANVDEVLDVASHLIGNLGYGDTWDELAHDGTWYRMHVGTSSEDDACLAMPDDRTLLMADETALHRMLDSVENESSLFTQLSFADHRVACAAIVDVSAIHDTNSAFTGNGPFAEVLNRVTQVQAHVRFSPQELASVTFQTKPGESTTTLQESLEATIESVRDLNVPDFLRSALFRRDLPDAMHDVRDALIDGVAFEKSERSLRLHVRRSSSFDAALQRALSEWKDEMTFRLVSKNSLALSRGLVRYFEKHKALPPAGSPNGLSWRVHLLPHIGHAALYEQFHLDEPWDSDHNAALLRDMPGLFLAPGVDDVTTTPIMAFTGPNTLYPPEGPLDFSTVPIPASTAFAVYAGSEKAVPWTKPSDIVLGADAVAPRDIVGSVSDYGIVLILCNGTVAIPSSDTFDKRPGELRRRITPLDD